MRFRGFIYCLFCLTGYDGNRIPYKTHMLIYDITIPWTDLRRCLPGQSKSFVGNILIGQNTGNPSIFFAASVLISSTQALA